MAAHTEEYITREQLAKLALVARGTRTQTEAAQILGVTQTAISKAENGPSESLDKLRIRMIETFTESKVEGPFQCFKVIEAK